ncbi:hypothetical protein [Streptomyces sp. NPDC001404]|uniref:hypothetical protein n=1 Tax=Streptomyces sp. NPDC001404 TaxID=3364571 RepID=UPI0036B65B95
MGGCSFGAELGYTDLVALESASGRWGRLVERDCYWTKKTLGEIKAEQHQRYGPAYEADDKDGLAA